MSFTVFNESSGPHSSSARNAVGQRVQVEAILTKDRPAYYLSRHPSETRDSEVTDEDLKAEVYKTIAFTLPIAMTKEDIQKET